jgi:uncharacterized protein (TIGR03437 family)
VRYCLEAMAVISAAYALYGQPPARLLLNDLHAGSDDQSAMFWSNLAAGGSIQYTSAIYVYGPGGLRLFAPGVSGSEETSAQLEPADFTLSSDGTQLVVSNSTGLTVINNNQTGQTQAVAAPGKGYNAHITPDGNSVFFNVAPFTGHFWFPYLYSASLTGGTAARLVRGAIDGRHPIADDGTVVFSGPGPDNDDITTEDAWNLYTMKPDGTNVVQLTQYSGMAYLTQSPYHASITPDGRGILFISSIPISSALSATTVWVMQSDGTGLRSLPVDNLAEIVTFTIEGALMAWSRAGTVHVQNVDTGSDNVVARSARSDIAELDFAPDNSKLWMLVGPPQPSGSPVPGEALWSVDLASGTAQSLYAPRSLSALSGSNAPGAFMTVYGTNLIPVDSLLVPSAYPLPQTLGGVSLTMNGRTLPITAVTPWQVNAEIPMDIPPGSVTVALEFADGTSTPGVPARLIGSAPQQYSTPTGCAFHGATGILADAANPAAPGEILTLYGFGLGVTNPPVAAGALTPLSPLIPLANDLQIYIALYPFFQQATVQFAGLSPDSLGLYQVNFQLPAATPPGNAQVDWETPESGITGGCLVSVRQ